MADGYLTTYGANALLDSEPMPVLFYVKGHLDNPGVNATANPAAETRRAGGLSRAAAAAGAALNTSSPVIAEAVATEEWLYLSLWDASTDGNPWWVIPLEVPFEITAGESIQVALGTLSLAFELWS